MMEAVRTSETSANFYQITLPNMPEDSHLNSIKLSQNSQSPGWDLNLGPPDTFKLVLVNEHLSCAADCTELRFSWLLY
jgi:hypothetical protein